MSETPLQQMRAFFDDPDFAADATPDELVEKLAGLLKEGGEEVAQELYGRLDELHERRDETSLKMAESMANLAAIQLAISTPIVPDFASARQAKAGGGPAGERLMAALLLLEHAHDIVPLDEENVSKGLDPLRVSDFGDFKQVFAGAVGLLRTAGYYVLDGRDSYEALASDPPDQETFPPLPFTRIWIETKVPGENKPAPYMRFVDARPEERKGESSGRYSTLDVLGVGLVEVARGQTWDVYLAFKHSDSPHYFFFAHRLSPLSARKAEEEGHEALAAVYASIRRLVVGGVHLITAKNVPHEAILLPRHQRKRMDAIGKRGPSIYYVNLAASGEHSDHESGREYHVRWLVRGHWRHIVGGHALCTCCEPRRIATWVEPYIKGPVGAPWKGRAVHRTVASEPSPALTGNSTADHRSIPAS